jgi:class 3 adenylate cyclase
MAGIEVKSFAQPDEFQELPRFIKEEVVVGGVHVARTILKPGWSWAEDMKPLVGTPTCLFHHQGFVISGRLAFETDDGARRVAGPGDVFDVPPGHDAWVEGDEAVVSVEFAGVRGFGKPADAGERVVSTLRVTDIVDSTAGAARMGDLAWKQLLGQHNDRVRLELDRFRGHEVKTTGDGFLAMFDGASRAVRRAAAISVVAEVDDLRVRAGIHSGEVERQAGDLRGVAVHVAARVAGLAQAGEVLVSESTVALLDGSDLPLEDAGEHELKGVPGRRRLYRLIQ